VISVFFFELQHQLFTIVVMDQHFNGIPVAWVVTESGRAEDIACWLKELRAKACSVKPDWSPNAVLVDDSDAEIKGIR
jgi:hypothetical protein